MGKNRAGKYRRRHSTLTVISPTEESSSFPVVIPTPADVSTMSTPEMGQEITIKQEKVDSQPGSYSSAVLPAFGLLEAQKAKVKIETPSKRDASHVEGDDECQIIQSVKPEKKIKHEEVNDWNADLIVLSESIVVKVPEEEANENILDMLTKGESNVEQNVLDSIKTEDNLSNLCDTAPNSPNDTLTESHIIAEEVLFRKLLESADDMNTRDFTGHIPSVFIPQRETVFSSDLCSKELQKTENISNMTEENHGFNFDYAIELENVGLNFNPNEIKACSEMCNFMFIKVNDFKNQIQCKDIFFDVANTIQNIVRSSDKSGQIVKNKVSLHNYEEVTSHEPIVLNEVPQQKIPVLISNGSNILRSRIITSLNDHTQKRKLKALNFQDLQPKTRIATKDIRYEKEHHNMHANSKRNCVDDSLNNEVNTASEACGQHQGITTRISHNKNVQQNCITEIFSDSHAINKNNYSTDFRKDKNISLDNILDRNQPQALKKTIDVLNNFLYSKPNTGLAVHNQHQGLPTMDIQSQNLQQPCNSEINSDNVTNESNCATNFLNNKNCLSYSKINTDMNVHNQKLSTMIVQNKNLPQHCNSEFFSDYSSADNVTSSEIHLKTHCNKLQLDTEIPNKNAYDFMTKSLNDSSENSAVASISDSALRFSGKRKAAINLEQYKNENKSNENYGFEKGHEMVSNHKVVENETSTNHAHKKIMLTDPRLHSKSRSSAISRDLLSHNSVLSPEGNSYGSPISTLFRNNAPISKTSSHTDSHTLYSMPMNSSTNSGRVSVQNPTLSSSISYFGSPLAMSPTNSTPALSASSVTEKRIFHSMPPGLSVIPHSGLLQNPILSPDINSFSAVLPRSSMSIQTEAPQLPNKRFHPAPSTERGSLLPKSIKDKIGRIFVPSSEVYLIMIEWGINWFSEYEACRNPVDNPPPILPYPHQLTNVRNRYLDEEHYYNTYFKVLLMESWYKIFTNWKELRNVIPDYGGHIQSYELIKKEYNKYVIEVFSRISESGHVPKTNDIVLISFRTFKNQSVKMLGYVSEEKKRPFSLTHDSNNRAFQLLKIAGNNVTKHKLFIYTVYKSDNINMKELITVKKLINIRRFLEQNDALLDLKKSPLYHAVIEPETSRSKLLFTLEVDNIETVTDSLRLKILDPDPLMAVIHTFLPLSQKIQAISSLITKLQKTRPSSKVIFVSKDNNVLSNTAQKLLNHNVIFISSEKIPELRHFSLDNLIKASCYRTTEAKLSKVRQEQLKTDILKKSDVLLMKLLGFRDNLSAYTEDMDISCVILDDAQSYSETESIIPLTHGIRKYVLFGNKELFCEVSPISMSCNYNQTLYHRACL